MISFANDYSEGAHPKILEAFLKTNMEQAAGYGFDPYSQSAREKIRAACNAPDAEIYFISGGTQTNRVTISSVLASYEGVISADSGHVNGHEGGAIENSGHKVLALPAKDGKLSAADVRAYLKYFYDGASYEHMVFPGMVYISWPTECGTLYTKAELEALHAVCREYEIPLYVDGARLAYGLMSRDTDVDLPTLAASCDIFYIGGTKCGALLGEALVFPRANAPKQLFTIIKQQGALMAKGRTLGIQFDTLFTDGLYFENGKNGIDRAEEVKQILKKKNIPFAWESPTNQQFVILPDEKIKELEKEVVFDRWDRYDETHSIIRFATSWATSASQTARLEEIL